MQSTLTIAPPHHRHQRIPLYLLVWLEPLWLAVIAAPILLPGLLPVSLQPLAVGLLLLFWPMRWFLQRRQIMSFHGLHPMLVTMLLWLPINLWVAVNQSNAWIALGYTLLGIALYITSINHPWLRARPLYLGRALLLLSVTLILVAPAIVQWKSEFRLFYTPIYDWFQYIPLQVGETVHANILAGALIQLSAIALALALPPVQNKVKAVHQAQRQSPDADDEPHRQRFLRIKVHRVDRLQRWVAGIVAVFLMTLLILTQSRGAYLALAVVLLVLFMLRWPRLRLLLPLLVLATAIAVYGYGPAATFELLGSDNTFGGANWRTSVWHAAGQAIHDFPYTGIGIGNFRTVLPTLYPHPALEMDSANHAHNLAMQLSLDLGLPGLLAYYLFVVTLIWRAIQRLRQRTFVPAPQPIAPNGNTRQRQKAIVRMARRHTENWALTAGALAAVVGIQVHGLLDAVTWGTKLAFLPWLCFALIQLSAPPQAETATPDGDYGESAP